MTVFELGRLPLSTLSTQQRYNKKPKKVPQKQHLTIFFNIHIQSPI